MHTTSRKKLLPKVLAAAALTWGSVGATARADQVPLAAPLSSLEPAGTFAIVGNLEFSGFSYTSDRFQGPNPTAANITVAPFTSVPDGTGITFNGRFFLDAAQSTVYSFEFTVTALTGTIANAYLSAGQDTFSGTGDAAGGELIYDAQNNLIGSMLIDLPFGASSDSTMLSSPQTTIVVQESFVLFGGSNGVGLSSISQGFSPNAVPEPSSLALCGLGAVALAGYTRRRRSARA